VDRTHVVEPAKTAYATKARIRRTVEAEGIPYTYVSCNFFAGYFLPGLAQPGAKSPPRDKVVILGDGTAKGQQPNLSYLRLPSNPVMLTLLIFLGFLYSEYLEILFFKCSGLLDL